MKNNNFLFLSSIFCAFFIYEMNAQVGINNSTPKALFDISASSKTIPKNTDGLLVPRIDNFPVTKPTIDQQSMIVYLTTLAGVYQPGFYFWNNLSSKWESLAKNTAKLNDLSDGKSDEDGSQDGSSVFLGLKAGFSDDSSDNKNSGLGYEALFSNTTGSRNTGLGYQVLYGNIVGSDNLGLGYQALKNTTGSRNIALGSYSLFSNLSGLTNIAIGYQALQNNTTGNYNQAAGFQSLQKNTTANNNQANGYQSLKNNISGTRNIAIGNKALLDNTTGNNNTAFGFNALLKNTVGTNNSAVGYQALYNNDTGTTNSAVGYQALFKNTSGIRNVALGHQALNKNVSASFNTAVGFQSLNANTLGGNNTSTGYRALFKNTTGDGNTAFGRQTLSNNRTGFNNTAIGYRAFLIGDLYENSTAVGYNTVISASNQARIGNSTVSSIGGYAGWTNVSDGRFKTQVKENIVGLEFIQQLRPVSYTLDMNAIAEFNEIPDAYRNRQAEQEKAAEIQTGFIAQEVEAAAKAVGFDFHGVDAPKNEASHYGLRYSEFVVPLVKAVQEQQEIIEAQKIELQTLKNRLDKIEQYLN